MLNLKGGMMKTTIYAIIFFASWMLFAISPMITTKHDATSGATATASDDAKRIPTNHAIASSTNIDTSYRLTITY